MRVDPRESSLDGKLIGDNVFVLELSPGSRGPDSKRRISTIRCQPFVNPPGMKDIPRHLPVGFTEYGLNSVSKKCRPFHVTGDDIIPTFDDVKHRGGDDATHQFVTERRRKIAVLCETR